jgi:hypothetical protein
LIVWIHLRSIKNEFSVTAKNIIIMEQESLPPLEEIDDDGYGPSFGKISTHSTAMASTDDEFDVAALDDDIEVAAEQVVDEWSDRLKGSDVFFASEEQQQQDEDLYGGSAEEMVVGTMNETLPAGGYDEVVMGYDGENADDEDDDNDRSSNELEGAEQQGGEDDEEEDVFEEEELVDETGSFSEEIIDDTEVMMDDGEIQEILDQYDDEAGGDDAVPLASPAVEPEEADDANDEEDGSVASQASGAFEHRNELLSVPPEAPQRQRSDGQEKYEKNVEHNTSVKGTGKGMQDSDDGHEADLDGSVDTSVAQDVVNVHETKQYAKPEAPVGFTGRTHDSEAEESGEEAVELGRTKEYINNVTDDLETGKTVAADTPAPAQTDRRTNANGDDDVDDDDEGFLICILVVACLCAVLIVLAIVLPLVFLRKRGPGPTLAPSLSPGMAPSSMVNSN